MTKDVDDSVTIDLAIEQFYGDKMMNKISDKYWSKSILLFSVLMLSCLIYSKTFACSNDTYSSELCGTDLSEELIAPESYTYLIGKGGDDTLKGNSRNNVIDGGSGNDTYIFEGDFGQDQINDCYEDDEVYQNGMLYSAETNIDTIYFSDIATKEGISLREDLNQNLVIQKNDSYDSVTINGCSKKYSTIANVKFASEEHKLKDLLIESYMSADQLDNPYLLGTDYADEINGNGGNDGLFGNGGDDILNGGPGNDVIYGGNGNDIFIFSGDFGQDEVNTCDNKWAAEDVIILEDVQSIYDIEFEGQHDSNIVLKVKDTLNQLKLNMRCSSFNGEYASIGLSKVVLSEGVEFDLVSTLNSFDLDIKGREIEEDQLSGYEGNDQLWGYSGNDWISGNRGDDRLHGGDGDDRLRGGQGFDTYYFSGDFGRDLIYENKHDNETNVIVLEDVVSIDDVIFQVVSHFDDYHDPDVMDLVISVKGTDNSITVYEQFHYRDIERYGDYKFAIDLLELANGQIFDLKELFYSKLQSADDENNPYLIGTVGNDTINGFAGDDYIYGLFGEDTIDGGEGDDYIFGGLRPNRYVFAGEFGKDTIEFYTAYDVIEFKDISSSEQIEFQIEADSICRSIDRCDYREKFIIREVGTSNQIKISSSGGEYGPAYAEDGEGAEGYYRIVFSDGSEISIQSLYNNYVEDIENSLTVNGDEAGNEIRGYAGNDILSGHDGKDTLYGGSGNDTLYGGPHTDYLDGEVGNDILFGGGGNDYIIESEGSDEYHFSDDFGFDTIAFERNGYSGDNNNEYTDSIIFDDATNLSDLVFRASYRFENLYIENKNSGNTIEIEKFFRVSTGLYPVDKVVFSASGEMTFEEIFAQKLLLAGDGNDYLIGSNASETINGFAGNDHIWGGKGDDTLNGGPGNDDLHGGPGADTYVFDENFGYDQIRVCGYESYIQNDGERTLEDPLAQDSIKFTHLNSMDDLEIVLHDGYISIKEKNTDNEIKLSVSLSGYIVQECMIRDIEFANNNVANFVEYLHNSSLNVQGNDSSDYSLRGAAGDDQIFGYARNDKLYGGSGNDHLFGGQDNDELFGGYGQDVLNGGEGNDFLYGDSGNDEFVFEGDFGADVIEECSAEGEIDTLFFKEASSENDLVLISEYYSLIIASKSSPENRVTLENFYDEDETCGTYQIKFSDGRIISISDALSAQVSFASDSDDKSLLGSDDADEINGYGGNDRISGGLGDDTINGGSGNDYLDGGKGNNTFVFSGDFGSDLVNTCEYYEDTSIDTIYLSDLLPEDISIYRKINIYGNGESYRRRIYVIKKNKTANTVSISDCDKSVNIKFASGEVISLHDLIVSKGLIQNNTAADSDGIIYGSYYNDTIYGQSGSNVIYSSFGDDKYIFDAGFGQKFINSQYSYSPKKCNALKSVSLDGDYLQCRDEGSDAVILNHISNINDFDFYSDDGNLLIEINDSTDSFKINPWLPSSSYKVEKIIISGNQEYIIEEILNSVGIKHKLIWGDDSYSATPFNDLYIIDGYLGEINITQSADFTGAGVNDVIYFKNDTQYSDLDLEVDGSNVIIKTLNGVGTITLTNWLKHDSDGWNPVDTIRLSSGDEYSIKDIVTEKIDENVIHGTPYEDNLYGSFLNDKIYGYEEDDKLYGYGGDDELYGGDSDYYYNSLYGGDGNDKLFGGDGRDHLYGEDDNDKLYGGDGEDRLEGGAGNDKLYGGQGDDTLNGGEGDNEYYFEMPLGNDTVNIDDTSWQTDKLIFTGDIKFDDFSFHRVTEGGWYTSINDLILRIDSNNDIKIRNWFVAEDREHITFEFANGDSFRFLDIKDSIYIYQDGDNSGNSIEGTEYNDVIHGMEGNDTISGGDGDDKLYGDEGEDTLTGGKGHDQIFGGAQQDEINGGDGNDKLYAGFNTSWSSRDTLTGGNGDDEYWIVEESERVEINNTNDNGGVDDGIDTIVFPEPITFEDLEFHTYGNDGLQIGIRNRDVYILLDGWYADKKYRVERLRFERKNTYAVDENGEFYLYSLYEGLKVNKVTPDEFAAYDVDKIQVEFTRAIDPSTFTVDDVVITGTNAPVVTAIQTTDDITFDLILSKPITLNESYTVSIGPDIAAPDGEFMDLNLNGIGGETEDVAVYTFVIDTVKPQAPEITNYDSHENPVRVNDYRITIEGTREDNTAIYIDGNEVVPNGSGIWSASVRLYEGESVVEISAKDQAGNLSEESVQLTFFADWTHPDISEIRYYLNETVIPAWWHHGYGHNITVYIAESPSSISLGIDEEGSGIDLDASSVTFESAGGEVVNFQMAMDENGKVQLTPESTIGDGTYTISFNIFDRNGNGASAPYSSLVIDSVEPVAPVINPVPEFVTVNEVEISGEKEFGSKILLGDQVVVEAVSSAWSCKVHLEKGVNILEFKARDKAGNISDPVSVTITLDDTMPGPVVLNDINGDGSGTEANIDWSSYDEYQNGNDIKEYRVYRADSSFADIATDTYATHIDTVPAGQKTYTATGLTKGQNYWFAVVAVDLADQYQSEVTAYEVTPVDKGAPAEVTDIIISVTDTTANISWTASTSTDIENYKIYFGNDPVVETTATSFNKESLLAATQYAVKVSAVDKDGNESSGKSFKVITWLDNPTTITADPFDSMAEVSWSAVEPASLVSYYALYKSESPITDISTLTRVKTATSSSTTTKVAGLENGKQYYFAVTAVNKSGGEKPSVTSASAIPTKDQAGPEISELKYADLLISDGAVLTASSRLSLKATDSAGVLSVTYKIDDQPEKSMRVSGDLFIADIDLLDIENGAHTITFEAKDSIGNTSEALVLNIAVELALPNAPVITSPKTGYKTNIHSVEVSGTADGNTTVQIYVDDVKFGTPVYLYNNRQFKVIVDIEAGINQISAAAINRSGEGEKSTPISVEVDESIPATPENLYGNSFEGGRVELAWNSVNDQSVSGYNVFRSLQPIAEIEALTPVNGVLISGNNYVDVPFDDGEYYYVVTSVNQFGTNGLPSNQVQLVADSTGPHAVSINYVAHGKVDDTGETLRIAPGAVDITVEVSEPLYVDPFMSMVYESGGVTAVELQKQSDLVYTGTYTITESTPSETTFPLLSMRDKLKNRGTNDQNEQFSILVDTKGPQVDSLTVSPSHPIKTSDVTPAEVTVTLNLSEALPADQMPQLSYQLSGQGRVETSLDVIEKINDLQYTATFTLPADAGATDPEKLSFAFSAIDDLGNTSDVIHGSNRFQVYQGDLPPLVAPLNLTGKATAGGAIELEWLSVEEAAEYAIFRKVVGEVEYIEVGRTSELTYIDNTPADADYLYAVKSVRQENDDETLSALSEALPITSDSTAPAAPTNVQLQLENRGMGVSWEHEKADDFDYYKVYRSALDNVLSLDDAKLIDSPKIISKAYIDPRPDADFPGYVVTAVDRAGNESELSNTAYENIDLLPVSSIKVLVEQGANPVLSWTHTSNAIAGYNLYLDGSEAKQNQELLDGYSYEDTGFGGVSRTYTITAVDQNNKESLARSITLPNVSATLAEDSSIKRGIMNIVNFELTNHSDINVDHLMLDVMVGDSHNQKSVEHSIAAGETKTIPVVIGGYKDLADITDLTISTIIKPNNGLDNEMITIVSSDQVLVTESALLLTMETKDFTRNVTGQARFTLENTSETEIEIITATGGGNSPSNEIKFNLVDGDDNVLATKKFKQSSGHEFLRTIAGGTVARIPAGESFTSSWFEMEVPAAVPDDALLMVEIDHIHYHLGELDKATIGGIKSYKQIHLVDTSYYGELVSISPKSSFGDQPIVITGKAVLRETQDSMADTPLKLVIKYANNYEKVIDIVTDEIGEFEYSFVPQTGANGIFKVSVVHPEIQERPVHDQFAIGGLSVWPGSYKLGLFSNSQYAVPVRLTARKAVDIHGIHIEYEKLQQPGGDFTKGISVELPEGPIDLLSGEQKNLEIMVSSTAEAPPKGKLVFTVYADDISSEPFGNIVVDYQVSRALPTLYYKPSIVETGLYRNDMYTQSVKVGNKGYEILKDVNLSLFDATNDLLAPSWIHLPANSAIGDLDIGEEQQVQIVIAPTDDVIIGNHDFYLRIDSSNHPTRDIPINVFVADQDAVGNITFHVEDIYTGTLDDNGDLIEGLAGATIHLEYENDTSLTVSGKTGTYGSYDFENIQAGNYRYYITAPDHQEVRGRIRINPGTTENERVFLDNSLITVEWSVTEITIEDRYEITLEATFETDVPTAVVVMEPMSFNLPVMKAGEIFNAEVKLVNHGLIRAENIDFKMPADTEHLKYELLIDPAEIPEILEAKTFFTIPFRVIQLTPFAPDEEDGSGGGCYSYADRLSANYSTPCPTRDIYRSTGASINHNSGSCSSGTGMGGPVIWGGFGGPSGGGGGGVGGGSYGGGSSGGYSSPSRSGISGLPACRPILNGTSCDGTGNEAGM